MSSGELGFWRGRALATAASWREIASTRELGRDVSAALTVACVALPLNLALAVASGLPAGAGLVTGIVASAVAALLGSSRLQISGPEAALIPVTADIVHRFGPRGLAVAVLFCGLGQMLLGLLRLGRFARRMPPAVVQGFSAGIGLVLLDRQLPRLLGAPSEVSTVLHLVGRPDPWDHVAPAAVLVGAVTIAVVLVLPRIARSVPAMLVALVIATAASIVFRLDLSRVGELPKRLPTPHVPSFAGVDLVALAPSVFTLVLLASLGSVVSVAALDAITDAPPERASDPDHELVSQGLANVTSSLFGGLPVMGAIVRSTTAAAAGARTRRTGLGHCLLLFAAMSLAAPLVGAIPYPALGALLLVVGARLVNLEGVRKMWSSTRSAAVVVIGTAVAIAATNFLVGIGIGLVLAMLVHLGAYARVRLERHEIDVGGEDAKVTLVRLHGPLTFLAQGGFREILDGPPWPSRIILDLRNVPIADSGGLNELQYVAEFLGIRRTKIALAAAPERLHRSIEQAGMLVHFEGGRVHRNIEECLETFGLRNDQPLSVPRPREGVAVGARTGRRLALVSAEAPASR